MGELADDLDEEHGLNLEQYSVGLERGGSELPGFGMEEELSLTQVTVIAEPGDLNFNFFWEMGFVFVLDKFFGDFD